VSAESTFVELPASRDCFRRLLRAGHLVASPLPGVLELRP
jgi:hypothetical protein